MALPKSTSCVRRSLNAYLNFKHPLEARDVIRIAAKCKVTEAFVRQVWKQMTVVERGSGIKKKLIIPEPQSALRQARALVGAARRVFAAQQKIKSEELGFEFGGFSLGPLGFKTKEE